MRGRVIALALLFHGCKSHEVTMTAPTSEPAYPIPAPIAAAIAAPDRSEEDRLLDAGRRPGEILAFLGAAPGMRIGELFAGRGYTTELLARTVGDTGSVYAQNTKALMDMFLGQPWKERAAKPVMKRVTSLERPMDDPFPAEVTNLDLVVLVLAYHDTVNMKDVDRSKMNKAVHAALKPGGVYAIVDHSAAAASGTRDTEALHRIDERVVKQEVGDAGFELVADSAVLRNPADPRDWNCHPRFAGERRGTSDRFALKFVRR